MTARTSFRKLIPATFIKGHWDTAADTLGTGRSADIPVRSNSPRANPPANLHAGPHSASAADRNVRAPAAVSACAPFLTFLAALLSLALPAAETNPPAPLRLGLPLEYQVHQRATRTEGTIIVAGSLSNARAHAATLEARLVGAGAAADWRKLATIEPGTTEFRAELNAPAGGWYRLEVRANQENGIVGAAAVEHVAVGEVFVIAGQSNSANHGEEKQATKTGLVAAFHDGKWQLANDPQPGATGSGGSFIPPFGDAIAERFKVPVGIIAAGVGATSVREWLPRGTRFPNPPTLTGRVTQLPTGEWESNGELFDSLVARMKPTGPHGFRAVLWHQGESDANQKDPSRTLPGELYRNFLEQLIRDSRQAVGWEAPWFVAQVSYHSPDDTGSPDIRAAQARLWKSGIALEGPDTDALTGDLRDKGGKGIHLSGKGLREHGARWAEKVSSWLEQQLAAASPQIVSAKPKPPGAPPKLVLANTENFTIEGRSAFVFLPPAALRTNPQPWIFYAPTLPAYPDEAERWMHEQFLAAGIAVAGVDAGEAYGSPKSQALFDALYNMLTTKRGFAAKPCLFGRSRGGLWVSSWAIANPDRIAGIIGIYPVFDFRTYPGLTNAAPAYGLTPAELNARAGEFNPIARVAVLAQAHIPAVLIHGDVDKVVPLKDNSAEFIRRYQEAGAESLVKLIVLEGQGHNFFEGFFHSQALVDFAIARARAGARP
jgi:alpha-beta hydrolase superfamily lysophospholipase